MDISVLNRALLLDDALDLARVGLLPYQVALNVTSYLRQETHYLPWKAALRNLDYIARMLRLTDGLAGYKVSYSRYSRHVIVRCLHTALFLHKVQLFTVSPTANG
jgi:hypothetical protein